MDVPSAMPGWSRYRARRYLDASQASVRRHWLGWNIFLVAFFAVEFILRVWCYHQPHKDVMLWVDALCVVPLVERFFYLSGHADGECRGPVST